MNELSEPPISKVDAARLVADHQKGVWRYLRVLGCEAALADDLTQETFLAVLQKPFQEISPTATAAFLRKVAHNLFISYQRRAGRLVAVEDVEALGLLWERWAGQDHGETALEHLKECLQGLTDRARRALELRFRDDRSRADIAAALALTEDGAKNLMQRAKKQLRDCLDAKTGS